MERGVEVAGGALSFTLSLALCRALQGEEGERGHDMGSSHSRPWVDRRSRSSQVRGGVRAGGGVGGRRRTRERGLFFVVVGRCESVHALVAPPSVLAAHTVAYPPRTPPAALPSDLPETLTLSLGPPLISPKHPHSSRQRPQTGPRPHPPSTRPTTARPPLGGRSRLPMAGPPPLPPPPPGPCWA